MYRLEDVTTNDVVVTPGTNDVTITWPTEGNADTYTIVIKKGNDVFCTLTFNKDGQLIIIRDGVEYNAVDRRYNLCLVDVLRTTVYNIGASRNARADFIPSARVRYLFGKNKK